MAAAGLSQWWKYFGARHAGGRARWHGGGGRGGGDQLQRGDELAAAFRFECGEGLFVDGDVCGRVPHRNPPLPGWPGTARAVTGVFEARLLWHVVIECDVAGW